MAKTYTVESTRKNPDKYIEKLKNELERTHRFWRRAENTVSFIRGRIVADWNPGTTGSQSCRSRSLGEFRVGDKLLHACEVTSVTEFINSDGKTESKVEYRLLRTRRVEDTTI